MGNWLSVWHQYGAWLYIKIPWKAEEKDLRWIITGCLSEGVFIGQAGSLVDKMSARNIQ